MKVSFKQPVKLGNRVYAKGAHDIPEAELSGWFFKALLKDGDAGIEEAMAESISEAPVLIEDAGETSGPVIESIKDHRKKRRK